MSIACGTRWPHDLYRHAAVACVRDDVSGSSQASGGLAVPYGDDQVCAVHEHPAGGHVRFLGGLDARQALDACRLADQLVVASLRVNVEPVAVLLGRDDDFKGAA